MVSSASVGGSVRGGRVRSSSAPMVKGRSERVNPAARTVTPASTTRLGRAVRRVRGWSRPVSRCFRVDPLAAACVAAGTTRMGDE